MSNGSELKSKGAMALRAAGYKPCPRYWLTPDQMELVEYMARQNAADVNRIRSEANSLRRLSEDDRKRVEMDMAWRAMRDGRLEG